MMRDDALLAFERHATSKLSDVKDLLSIATLGFRGEALPSIASVSRLLLETRSPKRAPALRSKSRAERFCAATSCALPAGTTITVRDLFYNVPARKKFLRSDQTEIAHIASLITHYSLAHPAKAFVLRHNNAELLSVTPVATLQERVFQVFGSQIAGGPGRSGRSGPRPQAPRSTMKSLSHAASACAASSAARRCRSSIATRVYLFVNGRLIRDRLLLHAISSAYHNLMPPACYPFALLFLDCDLEEVDVNVHPSKTEVRFRHGSLVHDFVRDTIREILMAQRPASSIPAPTPPQPGAGLPYSEFSQRIQNMSFAPVTPSHAGLSRAPRIYAASPAIAGAAFRFFRHRTLAGVDSRYPRSPVSRRIMPEPESLDALKDLRPLGQIHDSFIVAAGRDGLWIIDQHVAHERILFEQVLAARASGGIETQRLLVPLVIALSAAQQIEYARIAEELNSLGFETEPFGKRTIAVKSAPAGIGAGDVEKMLFEILEISERELRRASLDDLRRAMAASIACRAAIKINMRLEPAKIDWLLRCAGRNVLPDELPPRAAHCAALFYARHPEELPPHLNRRYRCWIRLVFRL